MLSLKKSNRDRRDFFLKPKMILKILVDLAMTVLLFLLMAYLLVGETAHEWIGLAVFILFLFHV